MSGPIHFAPLGSRDAGKIARLQRKLFPPELTEPVAEIRGILANTEKHLVCNFSFGLFDGLRMAGYVFAWVESESLFHQRNEEVVYIKEIGLSPGYENWLWPMFQRLYAQWAAWSPGLPLEAHALPGALDKWRRLERMFRHYGFALSSRPAPGEPGRAEPGSGPDYRLLRLDVAGSPLAIAETPMPLPPGRELPGGLSVTVATDPRQWLSLRDRWAELLAATPDTNVFQSFDYLWEWWKHYGTWNDLRIVVIRRGSEVVGAVPLMIAYLRIYGRVMRKLLFMTAPMEMNRPKFLFGREEDACLRAFLSWLDRGDAAAGRDGRKEGRKNGRKKQQGSRGDWDILDIDEQTEGAAADRLRAHFGDRGYLLADSETLCPYIDFEGGWDGFLASRSRRLRGNVRRLRRRLAERNDFEVCLLPTGTDAEEALDLYCAVEERSWKSGRALDVGRDRAHYYFYKALAERFGARGEFQMRVLRCDGHTVSATFGLFRDGVFQSLKIAHDRHYDRYSPGTVLESFELEQLIAAGARRYEFMGSFLANKLRWTSTVIRTSNIHIYRRRPRLLLFFFVYFVLKRKVKALLKRTGQFERADRLLKRFRAQPFPGY